SPKPANMAGHSPYFRANDTNGYTYGYNLLIYLGRLFSQKDPSLSLNGFLKYWVTARNRQVVTTEMLVADMEQYSGLALATDFTKYAYAPTPNSAKPSALAFESHKTTLVLVGIAGALLLAIGFGYW